MFLDLTMVGQDTSKGKNAVKLSTFHLNIKSMMKDFTRFSSKHGFGLSGKSY